MQLQQYGDGAKGVVHPRGLPYHRGVPGAAVGGPLLPTKSDRHRLAGQLDRRES